MKRNINKLLGLILVFSAITLASCVNGADSIFQDNGSNGIVEIFNVPARGTSTPSALKSLAFAADAGEVEIPVVVNYTGVNGALEDIKVHVSLDETIISTYNDSLETNYTALPSRLYTIDGYDLIIPKGQKKDTLIIKLHLPNYTSADYSESYALGVRIESASKGTVSGNYGSVLIPVLVKNKYDGVYTVTGSFTDYVLTTESSLYPAKARLITKSSNVAQVQYFYPGDDFYDFYFFKNNTSISYYGSWSPVFTFNTSTNKVTAVTNFYGQNSGASARSGLIDGTVDNYYDPATKTIHVTYYLTQNNGSTTRAKFVEVFTYTGSR